MEKSGVVVSQSCPSPRKLGSMGYFTYLYYVYTGHNLGYNPLPNHLYPNFLEHPSIPPPPKKKQTPRKGEKRWKSLFGDLGVAYATPGTGWMVRKPLESDGWGWGPGLGIQRIRDGEMEKLNLRVVV